MTAPVHPTDARRRLAVGAYGERLAAATSSTQGMVVLDRNWRCDGGEIDLVLRDGDVLVVCEVKTRSSAACGTPHEAVDRRRRPTGCGGWPPAGSRSTACHPDDVRIDLVGVLPPPRAGRGRARRGAR